MKVSSSVSSVGSSSGSTTSRPAAGAARQEGAVEVPIEQVDLSPLSSRLQEIEASLASSPAVNSQRVAEIKQAITEGRFQINPERVADGLLSSVRQMLNKQRA